MFGLGQASAQADVTAVKGSAYGYFCSVSAFGLGCTPPGPTPSVTLAPDASNSPQAASAASARADSGPATIFSSGRIDVSTQGTLGPTGSVTSSANIANVNASGQENFTASNLASTCTRSQTVVGGSTTITGGLLQTDNGDDDPTNSIPDHAPVEVPLATSPTANTTVVGHVHIGNTTDHFRWVFNEKTINADGSLTVNAAHQYLLGPSAIGDLILGQVVCGITPPDRSVVADFDGDGDTDRSVYHDGGWYVHNQATVFHGLAGYIPVPADYDGDGDTDRAVYRDGAWYIQGQATTFHGLAGFTPVPADYDGDGDADRAVYDPSSGAWYIAGQPTVFLGGGADDIPVPGDYDGDGDTDPAVYRSGAWYVHNQPTVFHGLPGFIPVPGDYDGDGDTDRAVFNDGAWHVHNQATVFFGLAGDVPVPGDYDGDGDTDRAVYRGGAWYVQNQATVFHGLPEHIPLPLPQAIYRRSFGT